MNSETSPQKTATRTYCTTNGLPVNVNGRSNIAATAWCFACDCTHIASLAHEQNRKNTVKTND